MTDTQIEQPKSTEQIPPPSLESNQTQQQPQPTKPAIGSDGKAILRFKGINIPGGKALPKGYKMSKDKTVEHILLFINKQLRDTTTTYRLYFNNCLLNPDDTIADLIREFQVQKPEIELTFSPIDNVFG
ncbi:hypothetical protein EHI8A_060620 [Entamoeba histolytica HM-1:IMSS-B]|uniref:Ubiquitin-like protein ATG12 n=6 Tax=Entamoeba histolytica TaxID=5759 RepID=C4M000_ENTH1|nr:hypothetical protein EHI_065840 [Entamoeba histolytica HM-1:IMSS]EMD48227.1 Hypothetical protein EHI5A_094420 [Entamoeba histolytica KU27]EMH77603.1 hypothetical protein EHI8A_060620 [Entamoeba histolytica HM-1:IMSS-B]EMS13534.1 hypothetical protein KM1_190800 [Entamoeba histolytica HM-3:IMSS]ENY63782.1 hypothetical protein EHI7A_058560 [Entamoeba histolytica HM-1:IMSS-A]GAT94463.1 hypothetical protein CL6EHI_065840 [Entamoeba histolytica]|eukprot:XP_653661.2 hypothetical protein EHI_065840 [Entamoeba histolytica HM-1:IMSS]